MLRWMRENNEVNSNTFFQKLRILYIFLSSCIKFPFLPQQAIFEILRPWKCKPASSLLFNIMFWQFVRNFFFSSIFDIQISFNIMFWQMPSGQTFQMRLIFFILFNFFSSNSNIYNIMFWQVSSGQTFRVCQIFSNFIFVTIFQIQIFRTFRTLNVTFWFSTPDPARQVLKLTVSRKLFGTIASRKGQI